MTTVSKRSRTIWVLVALAIFDGIANLFIAAQFMGWLPIFDPAHLTFFVNDAPWFAALLYAAFGVFWFVVAKWLYDLDRRGWSWVVTTASLNLVLALLGSGLGKRDRACDRQCNRTNLGAAAKHKSTVSET